MKHQDEYTTEFKRRNILICLTQISKRYTTLGRLQRNLYDMINNDRTYNN
jgi:hypothetical protein